MAGEQRVSGAQGAELVWADLWHAQAAGEVLSSAEAKVLALALKDEGNRVLTRRWQALEGQLGSWLEATPPGGGLAAQLAADIALSAVLQRPAAPFSLAAGLSRQIAAQASGGEQAASGSLETWLLAQPAPALPHSQAGAIARAIAQEAQQQVTDLWPTPKRYSWAAGLSTLLAFGGLGALEHLGGIHATASNLPSQLGLLSLPVGSEIAPRYLVALSAPASLLGLGLLIAGSALVVWRPERSAQRVALLLLGLAAVLSLPALWHSLGSLKLASVAAWEPLLVAGLLLQMALLFVSEQARALVSRQRHFPLQALAAGTLTTLGLLGLGLLLLSLGLLWTAPLLGALLLLAVVVGLGITLLSLGRSVRQRLLPAAPSWLGMAASLGIYGTSLALPPLAALLLLVGGAWGLGSLLLPREGKSSQILATSSQ